MTQGGNGETVGSVMELDVLAGSNGSAPLGTPAARLIAPIAEAVGLRRQGRGETFERRGLGVSSCELGVDGRSMEKHASEQCGQTRERVASEAVHSVTQGWP